MSNLVQPLAVSAALLADTLTREQTTLLAGIVQSATHGPTPGLEQRCYDIVPQPEFRTLVQTLLNTWHTSAPQVTGEAVAYLLLGCAQSTHLVRDKQRLELIWTGPETPKIPLRRTEQALVETIHTARQSLLIVSFAVYLLQTIVDAVLAAARRGVAIRICVESGSDDGGANRYDPIRALGPEIGKVAAVYIWPTERRGLAPNGKPGVLHAKCAVADKSTLFISSANLTGHAMDVNMELGVLIHGGRQPGQVADHFQSLMDTGQLVRLRPS